MWILHNIHSKEDYQLEQEETIIGRGAHAGVSLSCSFDRANRGKLTSRKHAVIHKLNEFLYIEVRIPMFSCNLVMVRMWANGAKFLLRRQGYRL